MVSYRLLRNPDIVPLANVPVGDALPTVASMPDKRQPCVASDEPLQVLYSLSTLDAYGELGILPSRSPRLRTGVVGRLMDAEELLPNEFGLIVLDGWRALADQQRLLEYYGSTASERGFVAAIDPEGARAPHTTGGAVDLTLSWQGVGLGLGTDYDAFGDTARLAAFESGSDGIVRRLRRLLAGVMGAAGMVCYGPRVVALVLR